MVHRESNLMFTSSKINKNESPSRSLSLGVGSCLHRVSVSTLGPLCGDASYSVLIENNGVTEKLIATTLWSNTIVFNENIIASVMAEWSQL